MEHEGAWPDWAWEEWRDATALDVRLRGSMADLCAQLAAQPELSFSAAAGSAGRQAFARLSKLFATEPRPVAGDGEGTPEAGSVQPEWAPSRAPAPLLAGHRVATVERCQAFPRVLVAQDTTEIHLPHSPLPLAPGGLGPTNTQRDKPGLLSHAALALSPDGLPLGVLDLALWARDPEGYGQRSTRKQRPTAAKESQKWLAGVSAVEAALPPDTEVVILQDREGDVFDLLAQARRPRTYLLLRAAQNRTVRWEHAPGERVQGRLFEVAATAPVVGELTVAVPRRKGVEEETAHLELRAVQLSVCPPQRLPQSQRPAPQVVTLIRAAETSPPAGQPAIEWVLVTTLPVRTAAEVLTVVGYYACRWRIERLHYVLKSGLQIEKLQHAQRPQLERAVTLYYLVAWRLTWLTYLGRAAPTLAASTVFTEVELRILGHATRRPVGTVGEAVLALGCLGGYAPYRTALPPGVKVLWRGYRRLQAALLGYAARGDG